ncbi:MAG: polymer-forming cytoskeletal protein [Verrucomicrobiota bacterium]
MSSKTPQSAGKTAVECPHCGFKQLESPFAKSTFCRKCSEHYDLGKPLPEPQEARPTLFSRLGGLFSRQTTREITCFDCGTIQTVSSSAKSSICPHCSAYVDLSDFKINSTFSRSVQTQGIVKIGSKGDVTSARVACSDAFIQGKVRGNLLCTGTASINLKGKLAGTLEVNRLVIQKRSVVEIVRTVKAKSVEISGKVSATLNVDGMLTITKRGRLEGTVYAKAVTIEKGGVFLGELIIGNQQLSQPDLPVAEAPEEPAIPKGGLKGPAAPRRSTKSDPQGTLL